MMGVTFFSESSAILRILFGDVIFIAFLDLVRYACARFKNFSDAFRPV